ncbi:MAG: FKBP-type peptidyl-prolyl cis-trans isomerase [Methylotenera sp.]|nr:FKBP-type peptidyl-prolyl cis-trans isomerase [Methylotenera sp.]
MKLLNTLLAGAFLFGLSACQAESNNANSKATQSKETQVMAEKITELQKIDTVVGDGREAEPGFNVTVHYTGWLYDASAEGGKGKKFDSSVDRGQPFNFFLGGGQVIQGWDEGFAGMKIGGKRTLIIPSEMGYGARGAGGAIPPNADLIFDVELLNVK